MAQKLGGGRCQKLPDHGEQLIQVDGDSDMAPTYRARAQQRNNGLCLRKSCFSSFCPNVRQFSSSLYVFGIFGAADPSLELRAIESKPMQDLLKGTSGIPAALHLIQPQSLMVFRDQRYKAFSFWPETWARWSGVGLETLTSQGEHSVWKYSS